MGKFEIDIEILSSKIKSFDITCTDITLSVKSIIKDFLKNKDAFAYSYALISKNMPLLITFSNATVYTKLYLQNTHVTVYTFGNILLYDEYIERSFNINIDDIENEFVLTAIRNEYSLNLLINRFSEIYFGTIQDMQFRTDINLDTYLDSLKNTLVNDGNDNRILISSNGNDNRCVPEYDFEQDILNDLIKDQESIPKTNREIYNKLNQEGENIDLFLI